MEAHVIVETREGWDTTESVVLGVRSGLPAAKALAETGEAPSDWADWQGIPAEELEHASAGWSRQGHLNGRTQRIEVHRTGPR